jgi:tetratricopeptide (TPR) repeat protein
VPRQGPARASTHRPTTAWGSIQSTLLGLAFCLVTATLVGELISGLTLGAVVFLLYRVLVVRMLVCRDHRRGVRQTQAGHFADAIGSFQASARFWDRWGWLDRSRGILLGSTVAYPFGQLARYNEAYCLSRLGRGEEAITALNRLLQRAPDMHIAKELLEVLEAGASTRAPEPRDPGAGWGDLMEDEPSMAPEADAPQSE